MSIVKQSLVGASGQGGGYTINDSLRFRSSASAYLSRTPASAGNQKTWTWSGWVKRSNIAANGQLFTARTAVSGTYFGISFQGSGDLRIECNLETAYPLYKTNALFRDPSAWYHIVVALDMTQATSTNRLKVYINGVLQTTASYNVPAQNTNLNVNSTATHLIGQQASGNYIDGYLTEINFIDGQALDPTDFGEYDDNGTWKAKRYTGTYGTNGFYLNGVGVTDQSGNGNNWTNNNLNLSTSTATTYDQMKDTPSLVDENAGNFCTLNPLNDPRTYVSYSDGNLTAINTTAALHSPFIGTIGMAANSGKYYWEVIGVGDANTRNSTGIGTAASMSTTTVWSYVAGQAGLYIGGAASVYYSLNGTTLWNVPWVSGNVIQYAYDANTGKFWAGQNNVWYNSTGGTTGDPATGANPTSTLSNTDIQFPGGTVFNQGVGSYLYHNFGQRPLAYTPPTGFKKLNTFNLPDSTIEDGSSQFNTVLYTGNGTSQSITGVNFQPDFVWVKRRSADASHILEDAVRGATQRLISNSTGAESTDSGSITSFDSDGFSVGSTAAVNSSAGTFVGWNWKAGGSSTSTNTDGLITSAVSANTTAGFSIVTYTGTGSASTVGHGLGVAPSMIIAKQRNVTDHWTIYHKDLGKDKVMLFTASAAISSANYWGTGGVTSTVFGTKGAGAANGVGSIVAYCFAPIEGYSAFGSYTGNGSTDGPFVYTGFRPAFVLVKNTSGENWYMYDATRNTYNVVGFELNPNQPQLEQTFVTFDFVSNGFKVRSSNSAFNTNGQNYIYMAFAENPFKNSNAR